MRTPRQRRTIALVLALALLIPGGFAVAQAVDGAGRPSADTARHRTNPVCSAAAVQVAGALQRYVDRFAGLTGFEAQQLPAPPRASEVRRELAVVRHDLERHHCGRARFVRELGKGLAALHAQGPLATAVAGMLRTDTLDALGGDTPRRAGVLRPADDLAAAVAATPPGGLLRLGAGTFHLDEPLYLLQGVRLVGAGAATTRLVSTAAGAAVVVPGQARFALRQLAVRHTGPRPASVITLWAGHTELSGIEARGGTAAKSGQRPPGRAIRSEGGSGVLVLGAADLRMAHSVVEANDVAGLMAGASARLHATGVQLRGNGVCGACLLGAASGTLSGSEARDNPVGVLVGGRARPWATGLRIRGSRQAGFVAQQHAHPVLRATRISDSGGLGIGVYGAAAPVLRNNTVTGSGKAGLLLNGAARARPQVRANHFADNGQADVVLAGGSRAVLDQNSCATSAGIVVVGATAAPVLSGNRCAVHRQP